ncbi:glycine/betaine ABC transporter substrate-binding protein [Kineosporia sp. J2-2]|uniref:Glycine/betaine ABC transporter substrate-binding protein n=1 Tax=Kineosporia corallincola TaxID=2835133 RepID=A0ABS5T9A3_9ACTN|nr:ABC transporter substrate-binding protein [Kineosporia corallincola]MBT0767408.1 glycine/betaine ABC transporter substrate-binding protein [Kineosporia corallincola]
MNRRKMVVATAFVTSALALTACGGGSDPLDTSSGDSDTAASSDTIVVGSANFSENELLAEIYAGALEAKGVKVEKKLNIGSRETYVPALEDGSIDLLPEYSGNLLSYLDSDTEAVSSDDVYAALPAALPEGLSVLEQSTAEDKDAAVVTKETADKYSLTSIADLKDKDLVLGGPPEWKTRATGVPGFEKNYGVEFKSFKSLDAGGTLTINALKNGQVDVADVFTTDPNIAAEGWVILEDPKNQFAAQNVVPLINKDKASQTVTDALNAVSAALTTENLTDMMEEVVMDAKEPADVADEFLTENKLS